MIFLLADMIVLRLNGKFIAWGVWCLNGLWAMVLVCGACSVFGYEGCDVSGDGWVDESVDAVVEAGDSVDYC